MEKEENVLIDEALKIYKIPKEYVYACRAYVEDGEVVIVTNGGQKLKHKKGEPAKFKLSYTEITGELPEQELVWNKKLNQRFNIKNLFKKIN
jgi:hypothetical protein